MLPAIICTSLLLNLGAGFELGAPVKSCNELYPKHHVDQMFEASPYTIQLDASTYDPGQKVQVRVFSPSGDTFRGLVLSARRTEGDKEEVLGTYENVPSNLKTLSWYANPPGAPNCVSHNDKSDKTEAVLTWVAPNQSAGDIVFTGSVVKDYNIFWFSLKSDILQANQPAVDTSQDYQISLSLEPISLAGCGDIKGCFLYPAGCSSVDECRYGLTYTPSRDKSRLEFEMFGHAEGYVSMAASSDERMGHETTVSCIEKDGRILVQNGYNPELHNDPHRVVNLREIYLARVGSKIHCKFSRPVRESYVISHEGVTSTEEYDLSGEHFLFLAWGDLYTETTVMKKHIELPLVSTKKINLFDPKTSSGRTMPVLLQVHGSLTVISWMTLCGIGVMLSKHFRVVLKADLIGKPAWLQTHRALACLCALLSAVAIIIMFANVGGWTKYATVHAILGLISMALSLLGLIGGFLRPDPKSRWRPYFAWIHRIGGMSGFLIAAAAMYLGFQVELVERHLQETEGILILAWLGIHVFCDLILDKLPFRSIPCGTSQGTSAKEIDVNGTVVEESQPEPRMLSPKLFLLAAYIIVNIIFMVASIALLCSS